MEENEYVMDAQKANVNGGVQNISSDKMFYEIDGNTSDPVVLKINNPNLKKEDVERQRILKEFPFFGCGSLLYGIVFAICMYRNLHGLFSTIMVCGTFAYAYAGLRRMGCTFQKRQAIYPVFGVLLGFNLMFTMDSLLLFIDYVAILLVLSTGIFSVIGCTKNWDFEDFLNIVPKQILAPLGYIARIFSDRQDYSLGKIQKNPKRSSIIIGGLLAMPLLVIVMALLSNADAVFGNMVLRIFDHVDVGTVIGFSAIAFLAILLSYGAVCSFIGKTGATQSKDKRTGEPAMLVTIGIILGVVYVIFCVIQIVYLFAGLGELPDGYTYARYAREGFFELLAVCLINLVIILVGIHHFREDKLLKGVLTGLILCTYLMVASSAYRMILYVSVYNLTVLRVWVLWTLLLLTAILSGALINVYRVKFSLFIYSMIVTSVLYLALAYARPAYLVARYNLSEYASGINLVDTLAEATQLNPDAAGPIAAYYENEYKKYNKLESFFPTQEERSNYSFSLKHFNIAEYQFYNIK